MSVERFGILICAYNEESHIDGLIRSILKQSPEEIIVVDDGSTDNTAALAQQAGATVIRNRKNLGKGSALKRGFKAFLNKNVDAVIVVDGDGQHDPNEIQCFLDTYRRTGIPVLIGNRMADPKGMPIIRKLTNHFMAYMLNRLTKVYVADPPCGFRFYAIEVLPFITSKEQRFAFEFDVLIRAAKRKIRIDSVRISTIYNDKQSSHIAPFRDSWLFISVVWRHIFHKNKADIY
ncbi:MAG: glycosyltransferase family 2 protein [Pontiellaceae bacterium]